MGADDYDVLDRSQHGEKLVGRIMRYPQAPEGQPWFWTITAHVPQSPTSRGYARFARGSDGAVQSTVDGMTDFKANAWAICERVAEAQAMLNVHIEGDRFTADELVRKLAALMTEDGLLRAMWEVGYFPPDTPPPVMIAGN